MPVWHTRPLMLPAKGDTATGREVERQRGLHLSFRVETIDRERATRITDDDVSLTKADIVPKLIKGADLHSNKLC